VWTSAHCREVDGPAEARLDQRPDDQMRGVKFEDADKLRKDGDDLLDRLCTNVRERLRA